MISRYKCSGSCNLVDDLFKKLWVPSKVIQLMFKVFNIVTIRNETKNIWWNNICPMIFHVNASLIVHHVIQIKNGIMINASASVKIIIDTKKIIVEP